MRENRTSGSEGGAAQPNASSLPLSSTSLSEKEMIIENHNILIGHNKSQHSNMLVPAMLG